MAEIDEFEEFKKLLWSDNPDMSAIKDALTKHPEWLTDGDKLKQIFPQRDQSKALEALGLENIEPIKNVLLAAAELHQEKNTDGSPKVSDEQLDALKEFKNPETNETALECIVNNSVLAENKIKAPDLESGALRTKIEKCQTSCQDAISKLTAAGFTIKQKSLKEVVSAVSGKAQENDTVEVGGIGAEGLTVDGANPLTVDAPEDTLAVGNLPSGGLTVNGQNPIEQPNENEAIGETPKEEDTGHKPVEFTPIKQGDIIDYMFEEWFLAGINWLAEKAYNGLDRSIGGYDSNPDTSRTARATPAPATPTPATPTPATPTPATPTPATPTPVTPRTSDSSDIGGTYGSAIDFIDKDRGFPAALASKLWFAETQKDSIYRKQAILDNFGKPADQWVFPKGVTPLSAQQITILNQQFKDNPRALSAALDAKINMMMQVQLLSARAATLQYMQEHKGENIDFNSKEVQEEIATRSKLWFEQIRDVAMEPFKTDASKRNPNLFRDMDKSLDKIDKHLRDFHTAKKTSDKNNAGEKIDSFNFTAELFHGKKPHDLYEEARPTPVSERTQSELENLQRNKTILEQGRNKVRTRKARVAAFKTKLKKNYRQTKSNISSYIQNKKKKGNIFG